MPNIKVCVKRKESDNQFYKVYIAASTDIVERPSGNILETDLQTMETNISNRVIGTYRIYDGLTGLSGITAGSETIQSIFNAMSNKSMTLIPVGSGYNAAAYPAANGTAFLIKVTQEFAIAFFQQVNNNSLYTGVYYKAPSTGVVTWTGWRNYESTAPDFAYQSSQPTDQKTNDYWMKPL